MECPGGGGLRNENDQSLPCLSTDRVWLGFSSDAIGFDIMESFVSNS